MKYALVNQQRQEPEPSLLGNCPACGQRMVAKCGDVKVWHWAHRGRRHCDHWWENETEWHRAWKDNFPRHWQEVLHKATTGERHIADVKTDHDWVIEFQHSHLKPDERRSRDDFYPKLIWVVDATRRKRDRERLFTAWKNVVGLEADDSTSLVLSRLQVSQASLSPDGRWLGIIGQLTGSSPKALWVLPTDRPDGARQVSLSAALTDQTIRWASKRPWSNQIGRASCRERV